MKLNELEQNVIQWAKDRGIYEHSTADAQYLKMISELGELADHVVKGQYEKCIDDIGDMLVCLINYTQMEWGETLEYMSNSTWSMRLQTNQLVCKKTRITVKTKSLVRELFAIMMGSGTGYESFRLKLAEIAYLVGELIGQDVTLETCLEAAWTEIAHRKGRMVPGGAFVKDEA